MIPKIIPNKQVYATDALDGLIAMHELKLILAQTLKKCGKSWVTLFLIKKITILSHLK